MTYFTFGNKKLDRTIATFNFTSASECPSRSLGLCQLEDCTRCYAYKDELRSRYALLMHHRQRSFWHSCSVDTFLSQFFYERGNRHVFALRFSVAGDVEDQASINKLSDIVLYLNSKGIHCYTYTARCDLEWNHARRSGLVVNGSGWKASNKVIVKDKITRIGKRQVVCPGKCGPGKCTLCIDTRNQTILFPLRRR